MNKFNLLYFLLLSFLLTSCITTKEVRYMQPSETLVINEEGLVPYNMQEYRITKNDILDLNIVTTPKGDAAQFYSKMNTETGGQGGRKGNNTSDSQFYFEGIKVDNKGDILVFGIGYIKAEGRTIQEIQDEIQLKVNENFLEGKSEARLNINGIKYYILGDIESTGMTGVKTAHVQSINILEAIAENGGLNRTIDRKNIILQRKYPEGIKTIKLDLTREDIMNSPYYWLQNGDMIYINTRPKSFYGFGKNPQQTLTTGISLLTAVLSVYLIFSRRL